MPPSAEQLLAAARGFKAAGQVDDAIAAYRQALALDPQNPAAWNNLANLLRQQKIFFEAIAAYRRAIALRPDYPLAFSNLAVALRDTHQLAEAITAAQQSVALDPGSPGAFNIVATILRDAGQGAPAIAAARAAIALAPEMAELHNTLAICLKDAGQLSESLAACRRAVLLDPAYVAGWVSLAIALREPSPESDLDQALAAAGRAADLDPSSAQAHIVRALILKDQGRLDATLQAYDQAVDACPQEATAHSGKLYALHFHPASTPASLSAAHHLRNAHLMLQKSPASQPARSSTRGERIRLGYVSPDLHDHVIARFLLPLLSHHNHDQFEIHCFSTSPRRDAITAEFQKHADHWHHGHHLSDNQLADLIGSQHIDILFDLSLHMAGNRFLTFSQHPAPLQISYLAYCSTTGLSGYRFTDPFLDPPGTSDTYSEKPLLLDSYWCYSASPHACEVSSLPALTNHFITFGSMNNFAKVTLPALQTWAQILARAPNSRLLLHCRAGSHRAAALAPFTALNIAASRIQFVDHLPTADYFKLHHQIDIAMDPFPYAGGTTSFDALYMGVPLVTLAGEIPVARGGVSILSHLGLPDLIATTPEQYIQIATTLASDLPRLANFRATLRPRLQNSILMDAPRFTRNLESILGKLTNR